MQEQQPAAMAAEPCESELVRSLREQNHQLFLQINQMEKFGLMEAEHLKTQMEENQREWQRKQQDFICKIAQLEIKLQQKYACGPVVVDLGQLDDSSFFQEIDHVSDSLRDSGLQKLQQWLTENQGSPADELEQRLKTLQHLRSCILTESHHLSPSLCSLFRFCNELCVQSCGLKEELKNFIDANEVSKCKIQEAYTLLSKCKQNDARVKNQMNEMKEQNQFWRTLYEGEVEKKEEVENTLFMLERKIQMTQTETEKLQEIIKDQTSRIQLLSNNNSSIMNDQLNGSKTTQSQSNLSTLSNFLEKALKPKAKPENQKEKQTKLSKRFAEHAAAKGFHGANGVNGSSGSNGLNGVNGTHANGGTMFKKKPYLYKFES